MSLVNFTILEDQVPQDFCVFRINAGSKYFIWKTKLLDSSITSMSKDLSSKIKPGNLKDNDLFFNLVNYIKRYRIFALTINVLLETKDVNELLSFEENSLKDSELDPNCLNNSLIPYRPKWINELLGETTSVSITIPKDQALEYVKEARDSFIKDVIPAPERRSEGKKQINKVSAPPFIKKPVKKPDTVPEEETKIEMPKGLINLDRIKEVLKKK